MRQAQWSPERPLPPPVSLASQSHHEKPPEVTCTSRGNPGFPASTRESPRETSFNTSRGQIPLPWLGSNDALPLATRMETRLPWRPTRGSLTSPSYHVRDRTLGPPGKSHVANFELPNVPEDYVHRIGRTGRAGSSGAAISLVDSEELPFLKSIERLIKREIPKVAVESFVPPANLPAEAPRPPRPQHGQRRHSHTTASAPRPAGAGNRAPLGRVPRSNRTSRARRPSPWISTCPKRRAINRCRSRPCSHRGLPCAGAVNRFTTPSRIAAAGS